jgi:uncharacterized protein (DUF736 family)
MEFDNTNTGTLFKNETDNEKAPTYKGKINVNGQEWDLAAWIKTSKSGKKFMSLKVQEPFKKDGRPAKQAEATPFDDDLDVPF